MGRPTDVNDRAAMAQIAVYSIYLIGGVFLCVKHGFGRSAGWLYIVILSLARIIGSSMRVASISSNNVNLIVGWLVLQSLGLSILILAMLGLVTRLFESLNRQGRLIKPIYQRALSLMMLVSMVLQIVGGTTATYVEEGTSFKIDYPATTEAGLGITIAVLVLAGIEIVILIRNQGYVAQGEHRIFIAILTSLPFIIARLAYSGYVIFGDKFPSPWLTLGLASIMEMIVVLIYLITGLTLAKAPPKPKDVENSGSGGLKGRFQRKFGSGDSGNSQQQNSNVGY